jgi:hypothetical protein
MNLEIKMESWNAATDNAENARCEVARILREYADKLEHSGDEPSILYDSNGNKIGTAHYWHADEAN